MNKRYFFTVLVLVAGLIPSKAQITNILNFNDTTGASPYGSLLLAGKTLYGTTQYGGLNNEGCVFAVDTNGTNYRDLLDFNGTNGANPKGSLVIDNGRLYGMATRGGGGFEGCIFSIDTAGNNYRNVLDFNGTNGQGPWGSLILLGTKFFGLSYAGGTRGVGCIFTVDTGGNNYQDLFDFTGSNGKHPYGDLTFVGTKFYGMTYTGGANGVGNIFSIDTGGENFADLIDFNFQASPMGSAPYGSLSYTNGVLYGMTSGGGANNKGLIFSVDTDGSNYKDLLDFNGANGSGPTGSLLLVNNLLYGTTASGGTGGAGNIFSIDTAGNNYSEIAEFNDTTGGTTPNGSLIIANHILYGTAYTGDSGSTYGIVFSTSSANCSALHVVIDSVKNNSCYGDNTGAAFAASFGGASPYSYHWSGSVFTGDSALALTTGTYFVTVTDNAGCTSSNSVTINQPAAPLTVTTDSVAQNRIPCNGIAIVTAAGGTSPYTYLWQSSQTTDTISGQCAGNYCCEVTDNNGCVQNACVTINFPNGINAIGNVADIKVYPKPTAGLFTISGLQAGQLIDLYDNNGQKLSSFIAGDESIHFNISDKATGIYLIRILSKDGNVIANQRLVKTQ